MKRAVLLFLAVFVIRLLFCDRIKEPLGPADPEQYAIINNKVLSPEENTLYRQVLNKIKPGDQQKVLIADSTVYEDFTDRLDNIYEQIPELSPQTVQNYFLRNKNKGNINRLPFDNNNFKLVSWDHSKKVYIDANNQACELRDPGIYGIILVSYIGFNHNRTQAVVSVVDYGAPLNAVSYLVFFVKKKDWVTRKKYLLWIS